MTRVLVGNLDNEVHIWRCSLDLSPAALEQAMAVLADDEVKRVRRYKFARDRRRFVAARAFLRRTLAEYLSAAPSRLAFTYGKFGKPELPPGSGTETVEFNLSHADDLALLAITRGRKVGIDVERIDQSLDLQTIALRFFSEREKAALDEIPGEEWGSGFFRCWTRKEAFLKAVGDGLACPLDSFDVSLDLKPRLLRVRDDTEAASKWRLYHLNLEPSYVAALAIEGGGLQVVWR